MRKKENIPARLTRRQALESLGGVAAVALTAACSKSSDSPTSPSSTTGGTTSSSCAVTPGETEGPYPDRLGMVNNQAFFRRDITEGRPGLPLTLVLTIVNTNQSCQPLSNAAIEIWQCDASGNYSEYPSRGTTVRVRRFFADSRSPTRTDRRRSRQSIPDGTAAGLHTSTSTCSSTASTGRRRRSRFQSRRLRPFTPAESMRQGALNPTSNTSDMVFSDGISSGTGDTRRQCRLRAIPPH